MTKTYKLDVNGQEYDVQIENPNASPATVKVNGQAFTVTWVEQGAAAVAAPVTPIVDEQDFEAYVPDMAVASTFVADVVDVEAEATPAAPAASAGGEQVVAPMPGKVLDIVVKTGDVIKVGDTLCNLEAMKMKSPIRSTADGAVAQILVNEGQNVNYGDVLFTIA